MYYLKLSSPIIGIFVSAIFIPIFKIDTLGGLIIIATIGFFVPWLIWYLPTVSKEE